VKLSKRAAALFLAAAAGVVLTTSGAVPGHASTPESVDPVPVVSTDTVGTTQDAGVMGACYGIGVPPHVPSCLGWDPVQAGCDGDATTIASGTSASGVHVHLRLSPSCDAVWTRYHNWQGSTGNARIKSQGTVYYTKELAGYVDEWGWTRMIPNAYSNKQACLLFYMGSTWGWVEFCAK
jgi:hypothetical protein